MPSPLLFGLLQLGLLVLKSHQREQNRFKKFQKEFMKKKIMEKNKVPNLFIYLFFSSMKGKNIKHFFNG